MVWLTQIVFYGACWLPWTTEAGTRQAILFDIVDEKLYLFDLVLWPQDGLLLAIVLILAATALFFTTAIAGRLFCGFACPQTVYTSIFVWIEGKIEGDHLARLRLDQSPVSARKLLIKSVKHGIWALVAAWTAITFVGYFTPIRELLPAIASFQPGALGMQETTDGRIVNSYTLKLINMEEATRQFRIGCVSGPPGLRIEGATEFVVEPGRVHTVTLTLSSALEGMPSGVQPIAFETVALHDPGLAVRE